MEDGSNSSKRRRNGFEKPWHPLQLCTWLLLPLLLVHFYAFLMFFIWEALAARVVITIVYSASALFAMIFAYITCAIDPADDSLVSAEGNNNDNNSNSSSCQSLTTILCCGFSNRNNYSATNQNNNDNSNSNNPNNCGCMKSTTSTSSPSEESTYCYLCESRVHVSSKHCRYCDKCVVRFDHHCKWLNTCIGLKNYCYFLSVVASVTLLTCLQLALSIAFVVEIFAFPEIFENRLRFAADYGVVVDMPSAKGLLVASVAVLFPLVAMVMQLASFHVYLLYNNITTYDFIVLEHQKFRERNNLQLNDRGNAAASSSSAKSSSGLQMNNNNNNSSSNLTNNNTAANIANSYNYNNNNNNNDSNNNSFRSDSMAAVGDDNVSIKLQGDLERGPSPGGHQDSDNDDDDDDDDNAMH